MRWGREGGLCLQVLQRASEAGKGRGELRGSNGQGWWEEHCG